MRMNEYDMYAPAFVKKKTNEQPSPLNWAKSMALTLVELDIHSTLVG